MRFCSAAGVGGKEEGGEKASGLFHFSLLSGESLLRFVRYRSFKPLSLPPQKPYVTFPPTGWLVKKSHTYVTILFLARACKLQQKVCKHPYVAELGILWFDLLCCPPMVFLPLLSLSFSVVRSDSWSWELNWKLEMMSPSSLLLPLPLCLRVCSYSLFRRFKETNAKGEGEVFDVILAPITCIIKVCPEGILNFFLSLKIAFAPCMFQKWRRLWISSGKMDDDDISAFLTPSCRSKSFLPLPSSISSSSPLSPPSVSPLQINFFSSWGGWVTLLDLRHIIIIPRLSQTYLVFPNSENE